MGTVLGLGLLASILLDSAWLLLPTTTVLVVLGIVTRLWQDHRRSYQEQYRWNVRGQGYSRCWQVHQDLVTQHQDLLLDVTHEPRRAVLVESLSQNVTTADKLHDEVHTIDPHSTADEIPGANRCNACDLRDQMHEFATQALHLAHRLRDMQLRLDEVKDLLPALRADTPSGDPMVQVHHHAQQLEQLAQQTKQDLDDQIDAVADTRHRLGERHRAILARQRAERWLAANEHRLEVAPPED